MRNEKNASMHCGYTSRRIELQNVRLGLGRQQSMADYSYIKKIITQAPGSMACVTLITPGEPGELITQLACLFGLYIISEQFFQSKYSGIHQLTHHTHSQFSCFRR
jgi:hypothetical protein